MIIVRYAEPSVRSKGGKSRRRTWVGTLCKSTARANDMLAIFGLTIDIRVIRIHRRDGSTGISVKVVDDCQAKTTEVNT